MQSVVVGFWLQLLCIALLGPLSVPMPGKKLTHTTTVHRHNSHKDS